VVVRQDRAELGRRRLQDGGQGAFVGHGLVVVRGGLAGKCPRRLVRAAVGTRGGGGGGGVRGGDFSVLHTVPAQGRQRRRAGGTRRLERRGRHQRAAGGARLPHRQHAAEHLLHLADLAGLLVVQLPGVELLRVVV
jgi:hypothetical protein